MQNIFSTSFYLSWINICFSTQRGVFHLFDWLNLLQVWFFICFSAFVCKEGDRWGVWCFDAEIAHSKGANGSGKYPMSSHCLSFLARKSWGFKYMIEIKHYMKMKLFSNTFKAFHKSVLEHASEMLACSEFGAVSRLLGVNRVTELIYWRPEP